MKTHTLNLKVDRELKEAIQRAAAEDRRSMSNLVIKILEEWVEQKMKNPLDSGESRGLI